MAVGLTLAVASLHGSDEPVVAMFILITFYWVLLVLLDVVYIILPGTDS